MVSGKPAGHRPQAATGRVVLVGQLALHPLPSAKWVNGTVARLLLYACVQGFPMPASSSLPPAVAACYRADHWFSFSTEAVDARPFARGGEHERMTMHHNGRERQDW